jgi:hypothetical protein
MTIDAQRVALFSLPLFAPVDPTDRHISTILDDNVSQALAAQIWTVGIQGPQGNVVINLIVLFQLINFMQDCFVPSWRHETEEAEHDTTVPPEQTFRVWSEVQNAWGVIPNKITSTNPFMAETIANLFVSLRERHQFEVEDRLDQVPEPPNAFILLLVKLIHEHRRFTKWKTPAHQQAGETLDKRLTRRIKRFHTVMNNSRQKTDVFRSMWAFHHGPPGLRSK